MNIILTVHFALCIMFIKIFLQEFEIITIDYRLDSYESVKIMYYEENIKGKYSISMNQLEK